MSQSIYFIDVEDSASIESLIDAFNVRNTDYETAIRQMVALHDRAFTVRTDFVSKPEISPLDDYFTFDILTGELIIFAPEPAMLVDALLEMAMFVRGFNSPLGSFDEWKSQFTAGAWRHVRRNIKDQMGFDPGEDWRVPIDEEIVERFNHKAFEAMLFIAGHPEVEVAFPPGADAMVITSYHRLGRLMRAISWKIGLEDAQKFNRRLHRTLIWIEESLVPPGDWSPFDELLTPGGFDDRFFTEGLDD